MRWLALLIVLGAVSFSPEARSWERTRPGAGEVQHAESAAYADWVALVVAGDNRASTGGHTQAFDNARRDVAATLQSLGIRPDRLVQYSVDHGDYPQEDLGPTTLAEIEEGLAWLRSRNPEGCLLYFTSHGSPEGVVIGDRFLGPVQLDRWMRRYCPNRPTILVVSACYSGIFAQRGMLAPNRLIMTAARADRSSFGCGEDDIYPFFDACFLEAFGQAEGWIGLAELVRVCVAREEERTNMSPPSEPQFAVGEAIRPLVEHFTSD